MNRSWKLKQVNGLNAASVWIIHIYYNHIKLNEYFNCLLILIWVDILGVRFEVWGGVKLPRLKLVRITLETWNLVRKYIYTCSVSKYTF